LERIILIFRISDAASAEQPFPVTSNLFISDALALKCLSEFGATSGKKKIILPVYQFLVTFLNLQPTSTIFFN
jgi:hypothetical protein